MILEGETILEDEYPVFFGYCYVADGEVVVSDIQGTIRDLKRDIGATEIRRCEIVKRKKVAKDAN